MFYLVSKHVSHCVGSTKVRGLKSLTVGQVFCLHCHCSPHRPRLATTCFSDGLENETLFSFMLPAIKLKSVSILEEYQRSIIFYGF